MKGGGLPSAEGEESGALIGERSMESVKWGLWGVKCGVWSGKCKVWSAEWKAWREECEV